MRTLIPLACATWLVALCPCWANEHEERFVKFPGDSDSLSYDLSTVHMIQPERFSITSTTIDNPDVMRFKLKVIDKLRTYCSRPAGKYPLPTDLPTLGKPDMPLESLNVIVNNGKFLTWSYPYKRMYGAIGMLYCQGESKTEDQWYFYARQNITNGYTLTQVFDCGHFMTGMLTPEAERNQDYAKAIMGDVKPNTFGERVYIGVCHAVMHEAPYLPPTGR